MFFHFLCSINDLCHEFLRISFCCAMVMVYGANFRFYAFKHLISGRFLWESYHWDVCPMLWDVCPVFDPAVGSCVHLEIE